MSQTNHTPEPWTITEELDAVLVRGADGLPVISRKRPMCNRRPDAERVANLRRLIACVNACEGIATEDLDNCLSLSNTAAARLASLSLAAQYAMDEVIRIKNESESESKHGQQDPVRQAEL